jgi:hypothetical protein
MVMRSGHGEGEGQMWKFKWIRVQAVKGMVMSGLTLLSKSKAHCLRITKETAKPIA